MSPRSNANQSGVQFMRAGRIRSKVCESLRMAAFLLMLFAALGNFGAAQVQAQTLLENIGLGTSTLPIAIAVNPVTHKVYTANYFGNSVSVIDGNTNTTQLISGIFQPAALAVDPVANKIYVLAEGSMIVVVIDGATNGTTQISFGQDVGETPAAIAVDPSKGVAYVLGVSGSSDNIWLIQDSTATSLPVSLPANFGKGTLEGRIPFGLGIALNPLTDLLYLVSANSGTANVFSEAPNVYPTQSVPVGSDPGALAVNPVTNKIFVVDGAGDSVTVIDGASLATSTVAVGKSPVSIAVNPVTNQVYVADHLSNSLTVIDGAALTTSSIAVGKSPYSVAVNPLTNQIYVANSDGTLSAIDGATGATATLQCGDSPYSVAVDPVTNRIYVANSNSGTVSVIDGATNAASSLPTGAKPAGVGVNPQTHMAYVANQTAGDVTVIDGSTTSTLAAGQKPSAVAVNPITNSIYVVNSGSNTLTVIDGATSATTSVGTGASPASVAVNAVTNKVYVANAIDDTVTVVDGATNATSTVKTGSTPEFLALNDATDKIYVSNLFSNTMTVINGATNETATVKTGAEPAAIAVNRSTNQIYVANNGANTVSVIDGATNAVVTKVAVGSEPLSIAVNEITNRIYVANYASASVTVIDGATNTAATVAVGTNPDSVAVNVATNKIYVANYGSASVTVIDGATGTTTTVAVGKNPVVVAVDPAAGKVYVANYGSSSATVLAEQPVQTIPLTTTISTLTDNSTDTATPTFKFTAKDTFSPSAQLPDQVFYQLDTWTGTWSAATSGKNTTLPSISEGTHILYAFATDEMETSVMLEAAGSNLGTSGLSPLIGNITSYEFAVTASGSSGSGGGTLPVELTITSASVATFTADQPGSFTVTAAGLVSSITLAELGPLPPGVTFTDNHDGTGTLAGNPVTGGVYPIEFTATASGGSVFQAFTLTVSGAFANLTPTTIDFGTAFRFEGHEQSVTITNTGTAPLTHIQATIVPAAAGSREFDADVDCPFRLQAGANCQIRIRFFAWHAGTATASLQIAANKQAAPQLIPVTATAIDPRAEFDPDRVEFDRERHHEDNTRTVHLRNPGTTSLLIVASGITGPDARDFSATDDCPKVLEAHEGCRFTITLQPGTKGPKHARLTITDNARSNQQSVQLDAQTDDRFK